MSSVDRSIAERVKAGEFPEDNATICGNNVTLWWKRGESK